MPKISYFLRSNNDAEKSKVLYCRVTFNKSTTEFSLKEKIDQKYWSQSDQKMIARSAQAKYVETLIESTSYKIKSVALIRDHLTARELIRMAFTEQKTTTLDSVVENYIMDQSQRRRPGTILNHQIKLNNLIAYQEHSKKKITVESFNLPEAQLFIEWFCKRAETCKIGTANRNVLFFKSAVQFAIKRGFDGRAPILNFTGEKDAQRPVVFLSREELSRLEKLEFESKLLRRILDLFLFQCYTGISYGDLQGSWQIQECAGENVLIGKRCKTGQSFFIPLHSSAKKILDKYEMKLPSYKNGTYNQVLKELAQLAQVDKRITTHTARKTFATLSDADGWTRETISKMLGHKSIRTTEIYYLGENWDRVMNEIIKRRA